MENQHRPPKLMHVVLSLGVGGAEKLVYDMMRHPAFKDRHPVVCCLQMIGPLGEKLREEGFKVYFRQRRNGFDYGVIKWLRQIMCDEGIEVVHAHQYTPLFYAMPAAKLAGGVKVIYTEHGRLYPDGRRWKRYLLNPVLALGVDHIVSISESTRQAMAKYDNFPLSRIKVIHNGVDFAHLGADIDVPAKRRELGLDETSRIIGTAARLESIKNIPMMLRAFKVVLEQEPSTYLLIAGKGPMEQELLKLATDMGIAERVKFLGLRYDLPEIYRLFEVFLLGSYTEGISITLLEAMASTVPAIVTDVGGNPEVVVDRQTGVLVPLDNAEAMAQAILEILHQPQLAQNYGQAARQRAINAFSFDTMLENYLHFYSPEPS